MAEGAGTIAIGLEASDPIDVAVVQIGDGALISGIARWLKAVKPATRIVGVCASGAPAMARSYAAGHVVAMSGAKTIATALAITEPPRESLARVIALVDEIVLVDDDDLRSPNSSFARRSACPSNPQAQPASPPSPVTALSCRTAGRQLSSREQARPIPPSSYERRRRDRCEPLGGRARSRTRRSRDRREHAIRLLDELSAGQRPRWTLVDAGWTPKPATEASRDNENGG
jgi:hypothetical protein